MDYSDLSTCSELHRRRPRTNTLNDAIAALVRELLGCLRENQVEVISLWEPIDQLM